LNAETNASNRIHDSLAEDYGYDVGRDVASRLKRTLIERNVGPSSRVLDVGCANGIHLRLTAPACQSAVGIDLNEKMVAIARERLARDGIENASVIQGDATALPFDGGEFDVAYSFSTLLLVPGPQRALQEISRVLVAGGIAIVDVTGKHNYSQVHWRRWYRSQGHFGLNAYSLRGALEAHLSAGLEPLELHGLGLTDQWKYVRFVERASFLERLFHAGSERDLDYRLSNLPGLRALANRWYIVSRRGVR
jgi:ubiquinone/menaquinone biosynthesis C-methylase UbiE